MGFRACFVGVGAMGAKLAKKIVTAETCSGLAVFRGRSPGTIAAATALGEESGVEVAPDVEATVKGADVIFTCLPRSGDVHTIANDLISSSSIKSGSVWIDCTSGDPAGAQALALLLKEKADCVYMDCAVSGGPKGAEAGTLTCMLGAPEDSVPFATYGKAMLSTFSKNIVHCGETGSGFAVKAVNNAMMGTHILVAAEGLTALKAHGVDPTVALAAINGSSGRSWATLQRIPDNVLSRKFDYNFSLELLHKDVQTCVQNILDAPSVGIAGESFPLLNLSASRIEAAHLSLGEEADHTEIVKLSEEATGIVLDK